MKKFLKNSIFLVAFMLVFTSLNAQDWMNYNSLLVDTEQKPIVGTQKIKPYKDDFLIEVQKPAGSNSVCFSIWERGDSIVYYFPLDTSISTVSDFTFLDDMVYFCGSRQTPQGNTIGIIGKFNIDYLIQNSVLNYQTTYIPNTEELSKIALFQNNGAPTPVNLLAIGNNGVADDSTGRIVAMNNFTNPNFDYKVMCPESISSNIAEIFDDIVVTEKYFVSVSHMQNTNNFILRRYPIFAPDSIALQDHRIYTYPNVSFNISPSAITPQFGLTAMENNSVSVVVPSVYGSSYYMFLANIHMDSTNSPKFQLIPNSYKDNKILEVENLDETDTVMILHRDVISGNVVHLLTYVAAIPQTPYFFRSNYLANGYFPQHFSLLHDNRFVMSGTAKAVTSIGFIFAKDNNLLFTQCDKSRTSKVLPLNVVQPNNDSDLNEFPSASAVWTNFTSTMVTRNLIIRCSDQ
ncbi:MAG: hypothetical protein U0K83_03850 [Bacteroidales bacterium]|nr:hypothetical protein [Bacteroidales bacterium]